MKRSIWSSFCDLWESTDSEEKGERDASHEGYMHPPCACGARDVLERQVQLVAGTVGGEWTWIR